MLPETPAPPLRPATPVAIGDLAGWFHARGSHGVLLCGAHGFEALSTHLGWHMLADQLAAQGLSVLRFDYRGDGDSLDPANGAAGILSAIEDIRVAAHWLRENAGITRLSCVALRFGALAACAAFGDDTEIDHLVLLAPPAGGRLYARQLRIAAKLLAEARGYPQPEGAAIDLCGYLTSEAEMKDLGALKLSLPGRARRTRVYDPPDVGPTEVPATPDGTVRTSSAPFEGYAEFMRDPSHSVAPAATFADVVRWIAEGPNGPLPAPHILAASLRGGGFEETRINFGEGQHLAGVVCMPDVPAPDALAVLMLNAGANSHEGWARSATEQARVLAGEGIASMRMDLSGLGDSVWFAEGPRPWLYSEQHIADALAGVGVLAERTGRPVLAAGLCAGGFVAFQTAARDPRIRAVVAANVLRLVWTEDDDLDAYEINNIQTVAAYGDQLRSGRALRRILNGEITPRRIMEIALKLSRSAWSRLLSQVGFAPAPDAASQSVRAAVMALSARGARVVFAHADRDQSIAEAERHFGPGFSFARTQPGIAFSTIPGADHELTSREARHRYLELIRQLATGH